MTTTETKIKIKDSYKGDWIVAITRFGNSYNIRVNCSGNKRKLIEDLQKSKKLYGHEYEIIKIYEGVSPIGSNKLGEVARGLETGKKIDLERILE